MIGGLGIGSGDGTACRESIAGQSRLAGMNVMAIRAADARRVHLAAEEGGKFVIFVADLGRRGRRDRSRRRH